MFSIFGIITVLFGGEIVVHSKKEQSYSSKDQVEYSAKSAKVPIEIIEPPKNPLDRIMLMPIFPPIISPPPIINPKPVTNVNP